MRSTRVCRWFDGVPVLAALMLSYGALCSGCVKETDATAPPDIEAIDGPRYSFGTVEVNGENLVHTFTLRSHVDRPVRVIDTKKTCGCLSVEVEPLEIPSGGECQVRVELETRLFVGEKSTTVVLIFDRAEIEPLTLTVDAYMVAKYRVNLDPLVWAIATTPDGPRRASRSFQVTEFLSKDLGQDTERLVGTTRVGSRERAVRVIEESEWTNVGWRAFGFARRAAITLEVDLDAIPASGELPVTLEFRHSPRSELTTAGEQYAAAGIVVRAY